MLGRMGEDKPQNGATSRRGALLASAAAVAGVGAGVAAAKIADDETPGEGSFTVVDRRGKQRFRFESAKPLAIIGGEPRPRQGPDDASYLVFNDENGEEKGGVIASASGALIALDYPNGDAIHLGTRWAGDAGKAALTCGGWATRGPRSSRRNAPWGCSCSSTIPTVPV